MLLVGLIGGLILGGLVMYGVWLLVRSMEDLSYPRSLRPLFLMPLRYRLVTAPASGAIALAYRRSTISAANSTKR